MLGWPGTMSHLTRVLLFSVFLLVSACTQSIQQSMDSSLETPVAATVAAQSNSDQQRPTSDGPPQTVIFCPDCQLVEVSGVVDGDTIDTSIGRVRFFGVDTPERGDECHTEATEFTRLLVGDQARLEDGPRLEDSYGRRLAYVFDSSGNSIDVQLIAGGFATAWTRDGQHRDVLVRLTDSAKSNQAGCLWNRLDQEYGGSVGFDPLGPDRDCGDFATHNEAQTFYEEAGGIDNDRHRLDADQDGIACESLE